MSHHLAIVIPSYYESGLSKTLESLNNAAKQFEGKLIAIVVLNQKEGEEEQVQQFHQQQFEGLNRKRPGYLFDLDVIWEKDIPQKKAGVGYARKIGMNRAVHILENHDLPIVNLDADCTVRENYCHAWSKLFKEEKWDAVTMHFEHPFEGLNEDEKRAIIEYEIHLRYYFRAQEYIGYPNAIQPIGSCMGVRKGFYQKIGGMNHRKAGEDFYFLQKCVLNGNWTYDKSTTIYPEARISDRVPFGTGKAMRDLLHSGDSYKTYNWQSFMVIQRFVNALKAFAKDTSLDIWPLIPEELYAFLKNEQFDYNLSESVEHTGSLRALEQRLFRWFHPFRLMKMLHYLRDISNPDQDVLSQANRLVEAQYGNQFNEEEALLTFLRNNY